VDALDYQQYISTSLRQLDWNSPNQHMGAGMAELL